jgi:glycosyltransferase involved in cell wall biosynthesis
MKKILITIPGKEARGGINAFYAATKAYYKSHIKYLTRGSRNYPYRGNGLSQITRLIADYARFICALPSFNPDIIHVNLTFDKRGILRDSIFILLSSLKKRSRLLVFFHGWDKDFADSFKGMLLKLIRYIFSRADAILVLSDEFKKVLESWGYDKSIFILTTAVNNQLIQGILPDMILKKPKKEDFVLLYLARVEKEKGIHIALDTYKILKKSHPGFSLMIAGDGKELEIIKQRVVIEGIADVSIPGHLTGHKIREAYLAADLYFFPTFYKEGLPTSILEAVCFGLPVVTRPVAGINDIFINEKMGLLVNSLEVNDFVRVIERLYNDRELLNHIVAYNYNKGISEFTGDKVADKLERIYSFLHE